jgi:hypothetical protein
MIDKNEDPFGMMTMVNTWMKSMDELWGSMAQQWSTPQEEKKTQRKSDAGTIPRSQAAMAAALKNWQSMAGAMVTPESMAALFKGSNALPEVLLKYAQTAFASLLELQQSMHQRLGRLGNSVEAYKFEDLDENIFRLWTDIYEKEFRQFFQIPQLGLLRTYQEKANQATDQYNLFQSNIAELLRLLSLPFNHTVKVMQEKLSEMTEKGELSDDPQVYYQMWVKVLEGHFMTLFQNSEYVNTLAKTVNSLADFSAARDAVLEDLLSALPVAKRTDLDDMAWELYDVKKRLRKLEKASNQ